MPPPTAESPGLELLQPSWARLVHDEAAGRRRWISVLVSLAGHLLLVPLLPYMPFGEAFHPNSVGVQIFSARSATPLVAPALPKPARLTQKEPNQGKVSTELTMADLVPQPAVRPDSAPLRVPAVAPAPAPLIEPPKMETANNTVPPAAAPPAAAPQIQPTEKPRNPFERVGPTMGPTGSSARLEMPKTTVQDAIRGLARSSGGASLSVGDESLPAGAGEALGQRARPGAPGARLELEGDPQGVDFKPYLIQVLSAVRRNWFAVMPESARLGQRGHVVIVFSILRNGRVGKLVFGSESGISGLDRAAVAGVSASDPFPPLPDAFPGAQISLRMVFTYNQPSR
jgi:TonB family protein